MAEPRIRPAVRLHQAWYARLLLWAAPVLKHIPVVRRLCGWLVEHGTWIETPWFTRAKWRRRG